MHHLSGRTISELASEVGVNVETVRYYEREGLMRQPRKPSQGWRRYDDDAFRRLRFIRRGQELGFSLAEIKQLLGMRGSGSATTCSRVARKAFAKVDEIDGKIRDLQAMREILVGLSRTCPGDGTGDVCPILTALDGD